MKKAGELHPLETSQRLWQEISINIIEPLLRSNDKDAIIVIVDQFTNMIRLRIATIAISSEEIAKIYRDDIWKIHGVSKKILSDRGPQFASQFIEYLNKVLGMKQMLFIAYTLKQIFKWKGLIKKLKHFCNIISIISKTTGQNGY